MEQIVTKFSDREEILFSGRTPTCPPFISNVEGRLQEFADGLVSDSCFPVLASYSGELSCFLTECPWLLVGNEAHRIPVFY